MIYPRIVDFRGKRVLIWEGILADWELAKDARTLKQTQRKRTVSGVVILDKILVE